MDARHTFARRLGQALPLAAIAALSLALLAYLAYGEARQTYRQLVTENVAAQGTVVQGSIGTFLLADLPLRQFPGFTPIGNSLLESNHQLAAVYVTDAGGQVLFSVAQPGAVAPGLSGDWRPTGDVAATPMQVAQAGGFYRVSLPLQDKVETVGYLHLVLPASVIDNAIADQFRPVLALGLLIVLLFSLFCVFLQRRGAAIQERPAAIGFSAAFAVMSVVVVAALTALYGGGIRDRSSALAGSLAARLEGPLHLGLPLSAFSDLDRTLDAYKAHNPEISFVALTDRASVLVQTVPAVSNSAWRSPGGMLESDVPLQAGGPAGQQLTIRLGVPQSLVYERLWSSVKNFAALLVAALLLSTVFFTVRRTLTHRPADGPVGTSAAHETYLLGLIGPLYFLTVVAESFNNSFLPQHFKAAAVTSHAGTGIVATLFTTWYLAYAAALLPAALLGERFGTKPLFIAGNLLTALNLLILTTVHEVHWFYLTQLIDGLGQGMVFIGVQSFIVRVASPARRTAGAALIVFGFNGGLIAGNSIGSLLSSDPTFGQSGVFVLGSAVAVGVALYAAALIPHLKAAPHVPGAIASATSAAIWRVLRDRQFISAALLVGVPTKVIMAGLISASLPLVLAQRHYATQDIGQILMIYSACVLISSRVVASRSRRGGDTGGILIAGLLGSAIGLVLIGTIGWPRFATADTTLVTLTLIAGTAILGIGHGCIQAPILSFVSDAPVGASVGHGTILSLYRLVERLGNVTGPLIVSQVLVHYHGQATGISVIGLALLLFIPLFLIGAPRSTRTFAPRLVSP